MRTHAFETRNRLSWRPTIECNREGCMVIALVLPGDGVRQGIWNGTGPTLLAPSMNRETVLKTLPFYNLRMPVVKINETLMLFTLVHIGRSCRIDFEPNAIFSKFSHNLRKPTKFPTPHPQNVNSANQLFAENKDSARRCLKKCSSQLLRNFNNRTHRFGEKSQPVEIHIWDKNNLLEIIICRTVFENYECFHISQRNHFH